MVFVLLITFVINHWSTFSKLFFITVISKSEILCLLHASLSIPFLRHVTCNAHIVIKNNIVSNRETAYCGRMLPKTLEAFIAQAMRYAEGCCTFTFQGGEPTLAELDFYRQILALEKKYSKTGVIIYNTIQTNDMLSDEA